MTNLANLNILDLRASLPRANWSIGTRATNPTSLTVHFNGPPVGNRARAGELAQVVYDARYHMRPGALGSPRGGDGLQYHLVVLSDGTICQTRDLSAILWHCGNVVGNNTSLAVHLPLGGEQDATPQQWDAATRLLNALIGQYRLAGRNVVRGHQEWSDTQCPGANLMGRLRAWRETLPGPQRFVVVYNAANVRTAPAVDSRVVLTMQPGETLEADAIVTGQNIAGETRWAHRADSLGFVHLSLLRRVVDSVPLPPNPGSPLRYRIRSDATKVYALPSLGMPDIATLGAGEVVEARGVVAGQPLGNDARWVQIYSPFGGYIHMSMVTSA